MNDQNISYALNADDYLETTVTFGEVKKTIYSKHFQGGKVRILFGSVKLDLTNADISGVVIIDVSQAFGETKITVPNNWRVETDITHILSATDDERRDLSQTRNSDKVLVITGISTFAEVKVRNPLL